jgi:hypothetical protein
MSQEKVELNRRVIDAFNRRDLAAYLTLTDPDVEFTPYEVAVQGAALTEAIPASEAGGRSLSRSSLI